MTSPPSTGTLSVSAPAAVSSGAVSSTDPSTGGSSRVISCATPSSVSLSCPASFSDKSLRGSVVFFSPGVSSSCLSCPSCSTAAAVFSSSPSACSVLPLSLSSMSAGSSPAFMSVSAFSPDSTRIGFSAPHVSCALTVTAEENMIAAAAIAAAIFVPDALLNLNLPFMQYSELLPAAGLPRYCVRPLFSAL